MRIAYVVQHSAGPESGVFKKITSQIKQWTSSGADVELVIASRCDTASDWAGSLPNIPVSLCRFTNTAGTFFRFSPFIDAVRKACPDLIYLRSGLYAPFLEHLFRIASVVLEVNTDDWAEGTLSGGWRSLYNKLTRDRILGRLSGIAFVSGELASRPHFSRFGKPFIVIRNGIPLDHYQTFVPPSNPNPRVVFIGHPSQPWQGVDKLILMAKHLTNWHFDIIGAGEGKLRDFRFPNVAWHGSLIREQYEGILASADLGIGPLALHRKNMDEASALKVAEYLACGIPAIIAYHETGHRQDASYLLQLPNIEDNIVPYLPSIETFATGWVGRRVPRDEIAHIDVSVTETRRLSFFRTLL